MKALINYESRTRGTEIGLLEDGINIFSIKTPVLDFRWRRAKPISLCSKRNQREI